MQITWFFCKVMAWYFVLGLILLFLGGCAAASGEMPLCESNCSMSKSWGLV